MFAAAAMAALTPGLAGFGLAIGSGRGCGIRLMTAVPAVAMVVAAFAGPKRPGKEAQAQHQQNHQDDFNFALTAERLVPLLQYISRVRYLVTTRLRKQNRDHGTSFSAGDAFLSSSPSPVFRLSRCIL